MQIVSLSRTTSFKLGNIAIYYKIDPFIDGISYSHTNNWEIVESVKIWNSLGFDVDVIDRNCKDWRPVKKYDIFLGLGVGNTGEKFVDFAKASQASQRCLIAMGPSPVVFNELVEERYENFRRRTNINAPSMRTSSLTQEKFNKIIDTATAIITIGQEDVLSYSSLKSLGLPIYTYPPAISPDAKSYNLPNYPKSKKHFLSFSGNGLICKGVDLIVEDFKKRDSGEFLHICGPMEGAFFEAYRDTIESSKNMKYHGFVDLKSEKFKRLISHCTWIISHSAAEACATAVSTCIKSGLIPVINDWNSIDVGQSKIKLDSSPEIDSITRGVDTAINLQDSEIIELTNKISYTLTNFTQSGYNEAYTRFAKKLIDGNK